MGYLKCKSCNGHYDRQPGESPDDFESCPCGGELEYYDDHGRKQPINSGKKKGMPPLLKIIIIIVGGIILFSYVFVPAIALLFMGFKYLDPPTSLHSSLVSLLRLHYSYGTLNGENDSNIFNSGFIRNLKKCFISKESYSFSSFPEFANNILL